MDRIVRFFAGPRGPLRLAALAALWSLPALGLGLQTDDHLMRWAVANGAGPTNLFRFDAAFLASRRESGFFPWWTSPRFEVSFFRPLSSLLHTLEFTLYPNLPALMLLVNVVLYAALVWVAAKLYQRLLPTTELAALAGLMFALDEGHGPSVGWIAGRNMLQAQLFSLLALHFHLRSVESRLMREGATATYRRNVVLSTLAVALALLTAEAGLCSILLILGAVALEQGRPPRGRLRALAPQLAVTLLWGSSYLRGGHGAHGSSWYHDLAAAPSVLAQAVGDFPLWITGLFGPAGTSLAIFHSPATARLVALPVAVLLIALLLPSTLGARTEASRTAPAARLMSLLALLCLAPVAFTAPSARVLLGASFGAFGLLALAAASTQTASARARWTRRVLLALHVWAALLLFLVALRSNAALEGAAHRLARAASSPEVVLVRSPLELLPSYALCLENQPCGEEGARSLHQLYSGGSELWIERTGERELMITATRGWGETFAEGIYCARDQLPAAGEVRRVAKLQAHTLVTTADARPGAYVSLSRRRSSPGSARS